MWRSPFLTESISTLEDIAKDPEEDEKVRWTANESIALIDFGQKAENFEGTKKPFGGFGKLSCSIVYEHWLELMALRKILKFGEL